MSFWTARNLRSVTGGQWLRRPADAASESAIIEGLTTDSRAAAAGCAFLALKGDRFDGHDFLESVWGAGAALLIISDASKVVEPLLRAPVGPAILRVTDTRKALGQIAAGYRRSLEGTKVIAVVGSNGKTTTTKLIHAVLSTKLRGSCSPKSFNNDIGVPLTILAAKPGDQYLVCEVGSNHPGETGVLSRLVQPDIVVVTSVGRDHMEFFPDLATVAREHASAFIDLRPGGLAVVPSSTPLLAEFLKPVPSVLSVGFDASADLRITSATHAPLPSGALGMRIEVGGRSKYETPLLGRHNAWNAVAAVAVARRLGLDDASIARGLASASPADMRLNVRQSRGVSLLVDCYNANPDSMLAAIDTFAELHTDPSTRVLILGDMLEMGVHATPAHEEIAHAVAQRCPSRLLICVGEASGVIARIVRERRAAGAVLHLPDLDEGRDHRVASELQAGDHVLLKGSRGVRLERVLQALEKQAAAISTVKPLSQASAIV